MHQQDGKFILPIEAITISQLANATTTIFCWDTSFEDTVMFVLNYSWAFEALCGMLFIEAQTTEAVHDIE